MAGKIKKNLMDSIRIRHSKRSDFKKYSSLLQESGQKAYTNEKLGLPKYLFSKKVYATKGMQGWMKSNLFPAPKRKTWLAFLKSRMVGAITVYEKRKENELRALYIAPDMQGVGLGKRLFKLALQSSKGKDVTVIMYPHNIKTLKIYKKWGFKKYGKGGYHTWPTWHVVHMNYICMRLAKGKAKKLLESL